MKDSLKPCPFCGNRLDIKLWSNKVFWHVYCSTCRASSNQLIQDRDTAVAAWNRRTPDARLEAERAVIEAAKAYKKFRDENPSHVGTSAREDLFAALAALARTEKKS